MNPYHFEEMCGLEKKTHKHEHYDSVLCLCGLQLTGNTHQLPKHGCVIGLGLTGERERNVTDMLRHLLQKANG